MLHFIEFHGSHYKAISNFSCYLNIPAEKSAKRNYKLPGREIKRFLDDSCFFKNQFIAIWLTCQKACIFNIYSLSLGISIYSWNHHYHRLINIFETFQFPPAPSLIMIWLCMVRSYIGLPSSNFNLSFQPRRWEQWDNQLGLFIFCMITKRKDIAGQIHLDFSYFRFYSTNKILKAVLSSKRDCKRISWFTQFVGCYSKCLQRRHSYLHVFCFHCELFRPSKPFLCMENWYLLTDQM